MELLVLRTCQRLELYGLVDAQSSLASAIEGLAPKWRSWGDEAAVEHLFHVTGGLESVAVGEPEVRDQVRRAAAQIRTRHPRPVLGEIVRRACEAADTLPTPRPEQSVAALASARVLEEVGQPFPRVLIVGSGTVGRRVAERLAPFARLTITYRSLPPPDQFLRQTGARATPASTLPQELEVTDAVITAAKTSGRLLGPELLRARSTALVMMDLGVPRNIDPRVAELPHIRLLDLTTLHRLSGAQALHRDLGAVLDRRANVAWKSVQRELWEPRIASWWTAVETVRSSEVDRARPFMGALSPEQWAAFERFSERLMRRILEPMTSRLRALPPGPASEQARRTVLEFVDPTPRDP